MAVKAKTNPCAQAGACVKVPSGARAYVIGGDPLNPERVLIEYEAKGMGTDSYAPRSLTLVQAAPEATLPQLDPANKSLKATAAQAVKLRKALNSTVGAAERWQRRWTTGLSDEDLKSAICQEFGIWGGSDGLSYGSGEKGDRPKFWDYNAGPNKKPTLEGKELVDTVRRLLAIPQAARENLAAVRTRANRRKHMAEIVLLETLASEINRLHQDCENAINVARSAENSALQHAKLCGEKLLEAKRVCGHGHWENWRSANLQIPSSSATLYQRVAERWGEIESATGAADLTLREAVALLKKPRQPALKPSESAAAAVATQPALESQATADPAPPVTPAPQTDASCRDCRHRRLVTDGSEFVCIAGQFREFKPLRDDWGKANGCDSFSLSRADKPVVNACECQFKLHGEAKRGQISSVLIDWQALTVKAVIIDHDTGQTQVPVSLVKIFQEEVR
jgi:hypothetical protein